MVEPKRLMAAYYHTLSSTAGRLRTFAELSDDDIITIVARQESSGSSYNTLYGGGGSYKAFAAGQAAIVTMAFFDVHLYSAVEAGDLRSLAGFAAKKAALDAANMANSSSIFPDQWDTTVKHVARMTGAQISPVIVTTVSWATARKAAFPAAVKVDVPSVVLAAIKYREVSTLVTEAKRRTLTVEGVNLGTAYSDLTNYGVTYGRDLDFGDSFVSAAWPSLGASF